MAVTYKPKIEYLIDWNDDGAFDTDEADIFNFVDSFAANYGSGVFNNNDNFAPLLLGGAIRLAKPIEGVSELVFRKSHLFRLVIGGKTIIECVADPASNERIVLHSKNRNSFNNQIEIGYNSSVKDSQVWHDALTQAGLLYGSATFNDYALSGFIVIRTRLSSFLTQFAEFAGGYVFEQSDGKFSFIAARANRASSTLNLDPQAIPLFTRDIQGKDGAVRNVLDTEAVVPVTNTEVIKTEEVTVPSGEVVERFIPAPSGTVVENWTIATDSLNPSVGAGFIETATLRATYAVVNISGAEATVNVTIGGDVTRSGRTFPFRTVRPLSESLYGIKTFRSYPNWGATNDIIWAELNRRDRSIRVAKVEFPMVRGMESLLDMDTGDIVTLYKDELRLNMLIGRKYVTIRDYIRVEWHLIELPTSYDDEDWLLDDDEYSLGLNTFLTDPNYTINDYLVLAGQPLELDGEFLEFEEVTI